MHMPTYRLTAATAFALFMSVTAAQAAAPQYTMQLIEPTAPYELTFATKINANGDALVNFFDNDDRLESWGMLTADGHFWEIVPPAGIEMQTSALNDLQQVVGIANDGAFIWSPTTGWQAIDPAAGYFSVRPSGINNRGVVVGTVSQGERYGPNRAFYWTAEGGMQVMKPHLSGSAAAINNKNQIVGTISFGNPYSSGYNAVVLRPHHEPIRLGDLRDIPGRPGSHGYDLNEIGTVLLSAASERSTGEIAIWTARDGLRGIGLQGQPYAINNHNEVVCSDRSAGGNKGVYWSEEVGAVLLQDSLVPGSPVFDTIEGYDINDSGAIAGLALRVAGAVRVGVILTPVTPAR